MCKHNCMKYIHFNLKSELLVPMNEYMKDDERTIKYTCNKALEEFLKERGYID